MGLRSPRLELESSAFPDEPGTEELTNPGMSGRALAIWLAEQLASRGQRVGEVLPEDFGWCVPVAAAGHRLYVACVSEARADRFYVFAFAEGGLWGRLRGRDTRSSSLAALHAQVKQLLEKAPQVRSVREEPG